MNVCFQKLYNTVNHCKMYTISYFNVFIYFLHIRDMNLVMLYKAKFHSE